MSGDTAMIKGTGGNDEEFSYTESTSLTQKAEEDVDMKTPSGEDEGQVGNATNTSTPAKREADEISDETRTGSSPRHQPAVSPPALDVRESVLREPAAPFSESLGSSVARLESFVASVVATDRKRSLPFGESCHSPPPPQPPRAAPLPPPPPQTVSRSRHSKVPKTSSRTLKSPTSLSQTATGGRMNRASRGAPAQISLPPSFVSPLPVDHPAFDQPLDLSTKSRRKSEYLSPDVANGGPSSLLSLERQFGKGSAIFERIGTKAWAAPYCAAALRLGIQSLAFGGGLGLVSSPSPSRRLAAGRPFKDRETVAYPPVALRQQPAPVSPTPTATDVASLLPWAQPPESKRTPSSSTSTSSGVASSSHLHTNLRCGCGASMDSLFALTVLFLPLC